MKARKNSNLLYLPSSPFNLLMATAVALMRSEQKWRNYLFLYDGYPEHHLFYQAIKSWGSHNPFVHTEMFYSKNHKGTPNLAQALKDMKQKAAKIQPREIMCSDDRRRDFIALMKYSRRQGHKQVAGSYIDAGLASYYHRTGSVLVKKVGEAVDSISSKHRPGASKLIENAWLAMPRRASPYLQKKKQHKIKPELLHSPNINNLLNIFCEYLGIYAGVNQQPQTALLVLPRLKELQRLADYKRLIGEFLASKHPNHRVFVKPHPDDQLESWNFAEDYELINPSLQAELVLPLLFDESIVLGAPSNTLLLAKWLRSERRVYCIPHSWYNKRSDNSRQLLKSLGIEFVA